MFRPAFIALAIAASAVAPVGCASTQKAEAPKGGIAEKGEPSDKPEEKKASNGGAIAVAGSDAPKDPIYFDFDSEHLRPESQDLLKKMAQYLNDNPTASVTIEGHCDDLGSAEYNLALGDKRARQAKEYLTKLGIDAKRVQVLSYGEEKPAIENATDDAAREKNRRDEFSLDKKNNG